MSDVSYLPRISAVVIVHTLALNQQRNVSSSAIEVEGMNTQKDWQAQQTSHLVYSLAGQRCLEA